MGNWFRGLDRKQLGIVLGVFFGASQFITMLVGDARADRVNFHAVSANAIGALVEGVVFGVFMALVFGSRRDR